MRGHAPFTLSDPTPDYATLVKASEAKPIDYPKPDNVLSFDKLSSVFLSNTNHEEDQPCHLVSEGSRRYRSRRIFRSTTNRRSVTARPASTKWSKKAASRAFRSMRRTACTARPATSRIRRRTSTGWFPREPADRTIRTCSQSAFEFEEDAVAPHAGLARRARYGQLGETIVNRARNQRFESVSDDHVRPRSSASPLARDSVVGVGLDEVVDVRSEHDSRCRALPASSPYPPRRTAHRRFRSTAFPPA